MKLRMIKNDDIKTILKIYKHYVKNTPITFDYSVPTQKKYTKVVEKTLTKFPWIVAEINGEVVGYIYASPFKRRAAFSWSVETSIYISEQYSGQGIGVTLYDALEKILKLQGIYTMYAIVTSTARHSLRFHEGRGFVKTNTLERCGWKFDQWYGVVYMEKVLGDFTKEPKPVIPYPELDSKAVDKILKEFSDK